MSHQHLPHLFRRRTTFFFVRICTVTVPSELIDTISLLHPRQMVLSHLPDLWCVLPRRCRPSPSSLLDLAASASGDGIYILHMHVHTLSASLSSLFVIPLAGRGRGVNTRGVWWGWDPECPVFLPSRRCLFSRSLSFLGWVFAFSLIIFLVLVCLSAICCSNFIT